MQPYSFVSRFVCGFSRIPVQKTNRGVGISSVNGCSDGILFVVPPEGFAFRLCWHCLAYSILPCLDLSPHSSIWHRVRAHFHQGGFRWAPVATMDSSLPASREPFRGPQSLRDLVGWAKQLEIRLSTAFPDLRRETIRTLMEGVVLATSY